MVVKKYIELMEPVYKSSVSTHLKTGFAFGLSQFGQYVVFAGMFFAAGMLLSMEPEEGQPKIDAESVFAAIFCIMFGA